MDNSTRKTHLQLFLAILIISLTAICLKNDAYADQTRGIDVWKKSTPFMHFTGQSLDVYKEMFSTDSEILIESDSRIFGFTVDGFADLKDENSLIRIVLTDDRNNEYLVYEAYPLIADAKSFALNEVCEETCVLNGIKANKIMIQLTGASMRISRMHLYLEDSVHQSDTENIRKQIKTAQDGEKIASINKEIKRRGLKWVAGETSVSKLSFAEKRRLFSGDRLPNLQGAEYYKGGILTIQTKKVTAQEELGSTGTSLVESFDWRKVHGADNPGSPYFDGDSLGSGWLTAVKSHGCHQCWAFAALHATEALVNLYFNQHLDLDLSEQEVASCSGGESSCCGGGSTSVALKYIINEGVADETCFPYGFDCISCSQKCSNPLHHIKVAGMLHPDYSEESFKREIFTHGPIVAGIRSWWHIMVLVGFEKDDQDGSTIWKFKNSWGTGWGDNGYGYLKVDLSDFQDVYALLNPVTSLVDQFEIPCRDEDGDGYYNWGITSAKPDSCPSESPSEKDCDDSNPLYGPMDPNGNCIVMGEAYLLTVVKSELDGYGTVTSIPSGIHCGRHCSRLFGGGSLVTLNARPNIGFVFLGWSGGCSGTGTCAITMNADTTVTATFALTNVPPEISPNEGTIGTQITITGSGFGDKKGKVLIEGVATKIATDGWKSDSISGTVTKVPPAGIHDVAIKPNKAADILLSNAFTVKPPEIDSLNVYHGVAGVSSITITGKFFSTKKGKVYLEYEKNGQPKKKDCKVTSWGMDSITFVVPKGLVSGTAYPLKATNKVGIAGAPSDFTID